MHRGYVGVFQNQCFWLWSPAGSQAIDRVVWQISVLDFSWLLIPCFGSVRGGSQPLIQLRAHPGAFCLCSQAAGCLSGRLPTRGFRCGPQATDWGTHPLGHFGSGAQAAGPLIRAHAHPGFQLWAPNSLIWVRASWASGEHWGCLSPVHSPGAEGGGAPQATAAAESSLTSS